MSQTLILEFSDRVEVEEALGHVPHGDPASLAAMLGMDLAELVEMQRVKRVQVSDALAKLLLSLLRAAAQMPESTQVYLDMGGDPTLASFDIE